MKNGEEKWFRLEFIKFIPDIKQKYKLTTMDTLVYGFVTEVINFQKGVGNPPVCFTSSKTIGDNIGCATQTVDNAIWKLKKIELIEVQNTYVPSMNRRYRKIYLPWEAPTSKDDKVQEFIDTYGLVVDEYEIRAMIWDWIHNYNKDIHQIAEIMKDCYEERYFPLDIGGVRDLYGIFEKFLPKQKIYY